MTTTLYVGTDADNGGAGLHSLCLSSAGVWQPGNVYPKARNVSFAASSNKYGLHYLVDERHAGTVGVFRIGTAGPELLARRFTHGAEPTYVALNPSEDRLAVANYGSGSIAVFHLDQASGVPLGEPFICNHSGRGPVEDRQDGPHAHCVRFDNDGKWLYHVDLGTDEILAYKASPGPPELHRVAFFAPRGSGPRHLVFHPTLALALLVSELVSTLTVLEVGDGVLTEMCRCSTLPVGFDGTSIAGHLALDRSGTRIYVTNRGHDSVAVFGWGGGDRPELLQHVPSGGASPRAFVMLETERQFILAHEQSGTVTAFDLLPDGTLGPPRQTLSVPGAVFVFRG